MKLNIDNKNYTLNVERATTLGILQEIKPPAPKPILYTIGQRFINGSEDDFEFILVSTRLNEVTLINLTTGNRWVNPVQVADQYRITEQEFKTITGEGSPYSYNNYKFTLIPKK